MLLEELSKGDEVVLELIWGSMEYKIKTQVKDVDDKGILIPAFQYKGVVLDSSSKVFKELHFNLYGNDFGGQRICWKSLKLSHRKKNGEEYYHLSVNNFQRYGRTDEHRGEKRVSMEQFPATIHIISPQIDESYEVLIKDISNEGIAFIADSELDIVRGVIDLSFEDSLRGHQFRLNGRYRCLRIVPMEDGTYLYGCNLMKGNNDLLSYIYLKRLLSEKHFIEKTESAGEKTE